MYELGGQNVHQDNNCAASSLFRVDEGLEFFSCFTQNTFFHSRSLV